MALDLYVSWSVYRWHFAMLSYLQTQTKMHSMIIHQFLKMNGERNVQQSWERRYVYYDLLYYGYNISLLSFQHMGSIQYQSKMCLCQLPVS